MGFSLWAYVLMPNHVHLIVHFGTADYRISRVLSEIKLPVSRKALAFLREHSPEWLLRLRQQRGARCEYHFWQRGGGFDRNITEPATLAKMIDYIHLNPMRKGLVERAVDWRWSSAAWYRESGGEPLSIDTMPAEWAVKIEREA
jgi:putative transposase